jgi:hypothetical protein
MTVGSTTAAPALRCLLPREHGAWGQLAMPLLSGLGVARPTLPAALLAAAAALAFLAHEPWLVAIGHRGARARVADGSRALRTLLGFAAAAAVTGGTALWLAPPTVRLAALVPAALASVVVVMVLLERERTIPGELAVSSALSSAGALVSLASGASPRAAATVFAVWALAFTATVFAVQTVLLQPRSRGAQDPVLLHAVAIVATTAAGGALALSAGLGWTVPLAVLPTAALSLIVCLARFSPARLRLLGWSLVASTTASLLLLLAGLSPR